MTMMKQVFHVSKLVACLLTAALAGPAFGDFAEYRIPTSPALRDYAYFRLDNVAVQEDGDRVQIDYDLPQSLVGPISHHISLSGQRNGALFIDLAGLNAVATCRQSLHKLVCDVKHSSFATNLIGRDRLLAKMSIDQASLEARRQVAASFDAEPIGTVTYFDDD